MFEIIPGILEEEWSEIERKIEIVKPFAKTIHIDIIDGKFAQNLTFLDPNPFKPYTDSLVFELHMMVENPIQYVEPFARAGFRRFLGHIENMPNQESFVEKAKLFGEAGLAIDGETSLESIKIPYDNLDCVLIMTINAGFSGQSFDSSKLDKIRAIREQGAQLPIEVDGGINPETIIAAKQAGATRFVTTSALFKSENPQVAFENLTKLINNT